MYDIDINESFNDLKKKFDRIKNMGYIKDKNQKNKGNSGLTFENLIGKENDEFQIADYNGIEIKVKNNFLSDYRYLTLFSLVPSNCFGLELKRLRREYGKQDVNFSDVNVLMKSVFANFKVYDENNNSFQLEVNRKDERIYLCIFNRKKQVFNKSIYWDFDEIIGAIKRKLNHLALVKYDKKRIYGQDYFKYSSISFYKFKGIETFFELVEKGIIRIYICLGVYKSGPKSGCEHDHGIRFDIKECNMLKLYDVYEI